jgi:hypothetical protein
MAFCQVSWKFFGVCCCCCVFCEGDDDDDDVGEKYLREFCEIKKFFEMKKKMFKYEKIILRWKNYLEVKKIINLI